VRGSHVLDRLWWEFLHARYDKVRDGRSLAEAALGLRPELLDPVRAVLRQLFDDG
jgi:hypothetical protein